MKGSVARLARLDEADQLWVVRRLTEPERRGLIAHFWWHEGQQAPKGDWRTWLMLAGRGFDARISTEEAVPLPESACVYCGNCIGVCPTGALMFKSEYDMRAAGTWDESAQTVTDTICPYCGVGCAVSLHAQDDRIEDLIAAGVIDPTKVVRSALQNAASIASLLLTTEALVSEIPEEKKEAAMPGGHGGGMGGMY